MRTVSVIPLFMELILMMAEDGSDACPLGCANNANSELSTDSLAQIRQQPHNAQPLSPSPQPHSLKTQQILCHTKIKDMNLIKVGPIRVKSNITRPH